MDRRRRAGLRLPLPMCTESRCVPSKARLRAGKRPFTAPPPRTVPTSLTACCTGSRVTDTVSIHARRPPQLLMLLLKLVLCSHIHRATLPANPCGTGVRAPTQAQLLPPLLEGEVYRGYGAGFNKAQGQLLQLLLALVLCHSTLPATLPATPRGSAGGIGTGTRTPTPAPLPLQQEP